MKTNWKKPMFVRTSARARRRTSREEEAPTPQLSVSPLHFKGNLKNTDGKIT